MVLRTCLSISGSWVGTFVPNQIVETMFFTFHDAEHYENYLQSDLAKSLNDQFPGEMGVRILANNWVRIPCSMSAKRPLNTINDFEGLKTRITDIKGYLESVNTLGAKPTQIAWGETYLALQQGVVAACEAPMDNMYTMKFYEPTKIISVTEHQRDNINVYINEKIFQSLSENQRNILADAPKESGAWYSQEVKDRCDSYIKLMQDDGC